MKISELITQLEHYMDMAGDIRCITPGFDECGYTDISCIELEYVIINYRPKGMCGEHESVEVVNSHKNDEITEKCLCIDY